MTSNVQARPDRIASMNICIDQLLWKLVPVERLVSLSYLTADPLWSPIAKEVSAKQLSFNHGLAEEIIPLHPDLILAGEYDAREAIQLLEHLGHPVVRFPTPQNLLDVRQQILTLGHLVNASASALTMAEMLSTQIQLLKDHNKNKTLRTAYWYGANGVVIGKGTLEDELMQIAGLRNLAAEQGFDGFKQLDLELLLSAKPQVLILEESRSDAFSLAREYMSHPALVNANFDIIRLPSGLSDCAASTIGDVVLTLTQAFHD